MSEPDKFAEHNAKPWYKRVLRWSDKKVNYIVGAVVLVFALGFCQDAHAERFMAGPGVTKYGAKSAIVSVCVDSFVYCATARQHGSEDRSSDPLNADNPLVTVVGVEWRSQFRDSKHIRPYTLIGIEYANRITRTQSTRWNSTLGLGALFVRQQWYADLGLRHGSNAGLKKPNSGRDALYLQIGRSF